MPPASMPRRTRPGQPGRRSDRSSRGHGPLPQRRSVSPSGGLRVEGLRPLVTEWVSEAGFPAVGARRSTDRAHDASSAVRRPARRHRAKWLPEEASTVDERFHPGGLEPAGDLVGMEAYAPSPAEVGDAALVDEPADVTVRHAEVLSELRDVDQVRKVLGFPISLLATSLCHTRSTCIEHSGTRRLSRSTATRYRRPLLLPVNSVTRISERHRLARSAMRT
jgi:hypothetical protein